MAINESIIKRKAIRKYLNAPLTESELENIDKCIKDISPVLPEIGCSMRVVNRNEFKDSYGGLFVIDAPHYVVIYGENKASSIMNASTAGHTLMLALTAMNYATCWLGGAKPKGGNASKDELFIGAFCFGNSEEAFRQSEFDANRKKLEEIAYGETEPHIDALRAGRLAPSGMNIQPVRYLCSGKKIHIFRSKSKNALGLFDKMQTIDCGIAIATIRAAYPEYKFHIEKICPTLKSSVYIGTLEKKGKGESKGGSNE